MTEKSMIDRHVLSFRAGPLVGVQRDIKLTLGDRVVNEVSYFLSYQGQIKEVAFEFSDLKIDIEKMNQLLVQGKVTARNYHINCLSKGDGFLLIDFDFDVLIEFKIAAGVLDACGEALSKQSSELQMDIYSLKLDTQTRVSN